MEQDPIVTAPPYICIIVYKISLQMLPHLIQFNPFICKMEPTMPILSPLTRGDYRDSGPLSDLPKGRQKVRPRVKGIGVAGYLLR